MTLYLSGISVPALTAHRALYWWLIHLSMVDQCPSFPQRQSSQSPEAFFFLSTQHLGLNIFSFSSCKSEYQYQTKIQFFNAEESKLHIKLFLYLSVLGCIQRKMEGGGGERCFLFLDSASFDTFC